MIPESVLPTCPICDEPVEPEIGTTDEKGRTVHIPCHMLSFIIETPRNTE